MIVLTGFVAAIGVVIYDAIIDVENIVRRLRNRTDRSLKATARVVLDASHEARSAIVYAALIVLLAVAPIYFMGGTSGAFFKPLAVSYGLAIIASMVVTLTVVPALCLMFVRNESATSRRIAARPLAPKHAMNRRSVTPSSAVVWQWPPSALSRLIGLAIVPLLSRAPMPAFKELSLLIQLESRARHVPARDEPDYRPHGR